MPQTSDVQLHGFTDSNWAGSADDRKSTYGICFRLGYVMISWASRKQKFVALNTTEAKYIATCLACCEGVWLHNLLSGLFGQMLELTLHFHDNQSFVKLTRNPMFHDKSKHINIRCHFVKDCVQRGAI